MPIGRAPFTFRTSLDGLIALVALVLTSPLTLAGWVAVLLEDGWPAHFAQTRVGVGGHTFRLYKLRTMRETGACGGARADGQRLLRVGRLLRASSVDELPSLWNVIRGDMALVGPRPLLPEYTERYSPQQRRRLEVRPGLTGWAQVNGRNSISWEEKFRLDVWYVDNRSLWLDVKILGMTVVQVLSRRGISAPSHATMPPFEGSGTKRSQ